MGDYVLCADVCVERKSHEDLCQSLANGRLHAQCEQMMRHYEKCYKFHFDQPRISFTCPHRGTTRHQRLPEGAQESRQEDRVQWRAEQEVRLFDGLLYAGLL